MQPPPELIYYGKVPTRGDFVRSPRHTSLIQTLDRWLSQAMELTMQDTRWKLVYDQAPALHFAFLDSQGPVGLAGHLLPSRDTAGRRFPFITACAFETSGTEFLNRSPLVLSRPWERMAHCAQLLVGVRAGEDLQSAVGQTPMEALASSDAYEASVADFLHLQRVHDLEQMLRASGHPVCLRQTVLALGLLMAPLRSIPGARLDKGLWLPLVSDPLYRPLVAMLWMTLITHFLREGRCELSICLPLSDQCHGMVVGFNGASPRSLRALLARQQATHEHIDLRYSHWVEAHVQSRHSLKRLSNYLRDPALSLRQALITYRETFAGTEP